VPLLYAKDSEDKYERKRPGKNFNFPGKQGKIDR